MADKKKTPAQKKMDAIKLNKETAARLEPLRKPRTRQQLLDDAQMLMNGACEASPAQALTLARKALQLTADCADAYLLLADLGARSIREKLDLIRQAIEAGRRALGEKEFKEAVGHFWMIKETRPFMRAMEQMAEIQWEIGAGDAAIEIWREMLRLNPNDNQGVRCSLLGCLLELQRNDEALELIRSDEGNPMADWVYGNALLTFRLEGDSAAAREKLALAVKRNPHVSAYLSGAKKTPKRLPDYVSLGGESEAALYVEANVVGWEKTPGALEWLATQKK